MEDHGGGGGPAGWDVWTKSSGKRCTVVRNLSSSAGVEVVRELSHFSHVRLFATPWTAGSSVLGILQARILQWVAGPFSRSTMWISREYTYVPAFLSLPPTPTSRPPGHHRAWSWAPCAVQQLPTSYLFHAWWWRLPVPPSQFIPPSPSLSVTTVCSLLQGQALLPRHPDGK